MAELNRPRRGQPDGAEASQGPGHEPRERVSPPTPKVSRRRHFARDLSVDELRALQRRRELGDLAHARRSRGEALEPAQQWAEALADAFYGVGDWTPEKLVERLERMGLRGFSIDDAMRSVVVRLGRTMQHRLLAPAVVGAKLHLSKAERRSLESSRSLAAVDESPEERRAFNRQRHRDVDRTSQVAKRRKAGVVPRQDYLAACAAVPKPWLKYGVVQRTWNRWKKTGKIPPEGT